MSAVAPEATLTHKENREAIDAVVRPRPHPYADPRH
jgi:hypothetical protein